MQKLLVAFLLLLFTTHSNLATAQSAPLLAQEDPVRLAPKPALEGPVSQVEGLWRLTSLVLKGAPAPGTNGQFQEFGETYVMENTLAFWSRFGAGDKEWGLFSIREGKLSNVFVNGVEFIAPDSRKIKVLRGDPYRGVIHAGKGMLYLSYTFPDHLYGWDGDRLVRVLCAGDQLEVSGTRYTVKSAKLHDVGPDGRALIYYHANKPRDMDGWVLHDGTNFTPLWKEGDSLPGMSGVQIKDLSSGARLLEDGSILATLEVTGAPYKKALFRLSRDKAEKIIEEKFTWRGKANLETQGPDGHYIEMLGDLPVAQSESFVMDLKSGTRVQVKRLRVEDTGRVNFCQPPILLLLFYHQGEFELESCAGLRELSALHGVHGRWFSPAPDDSIAVDRGVFLTPGSPRLVFTVKATRRLEVGKFSRKYLDTSFPGLYFWDGRQISEVPWETALGMDIPRASKALETESKSMSPGPAKVIGLRRITRPVSGVTISLPASGPNGSRWLIPSDSTDGKLERGPQFQVPGRTVTVADIVAWKSPEEAVVELEDGFFLLTKAADVK
jgi:hypothetical protein